MERQKDGEYKLETILVVFKGFFPFQGSPIALQLLIKINNNPFINSIRMWSLYNARII